MQAISSGIPAVFPGSGCFVRHSCARDYSINPALVYWEMTRACQLACRHCRAEAMSTPHPGELTHIESKALLLQIAGFNRPLPHLILTGGDPLERNDLYELIDEARRLQLTVSITPSATSRLTAEVLGRLKEHEIDSIGLSLDGSTAARHEAVRGVDGCFERTMSAIKAASDLGFPVQINTLIAQATADDLPQIYELLKTLGIMRRSLFFLISVGRGKMLQPLDPRQGERWMNWVFELSQTAPFQLKTTEAPSYRRVALERMKKAGLDSSQITQSSVYRGFRIRDGHGIVFVSHQGDVYPAGFLPLKAGNVRSEHLVDIYRNSSLFCALHEPDQFRGKCGRCDYRQICGGSRARAFASSGDALASDPLCPFEPHINQDSFLVF